LVANNGGSQELIPLRQSLPPTPGQPASLRPTCQVGRPVGPQGCTVPGQTGPDGTPLTCLPPDQAASSPPICKQYYWVGDGHASHTNKLAWLPWPTPC